MQVWHFSEGLAQSIPDADGRFRSDKAYVVLAPPANGEGQQRLYLWAGNDAPQDAKSTAAKHASELKETLGAAYLRQAQGQESDEFKQLFASFSVVEAAADPVTEAVPPQVGAAADGAAAPGGGEEGGEGEEHEEEDDGADDGADTVGSPTATGGKKKKRRSKKKGHQGGSQQGEVGAAAVGSPRAAGAASPAAGSPRRPNSPPAARPSTPPAAAASPLTSPRGSIVSPRSSFQLHIDAPPFTPRSLQAMGATPFGMAEPASPAAPKAASPSAAQPAPAKQASASPPAAAPAAASPAAAAPAEATPKPASPKLSVEESGPESVAKAKQQLMGKLSGSLTDPLGEKQQQQKQANGAAGGKAGTTFMAESAKAWGGVSGGEAPPAPQTAEVKVKPGEKTFGYEELKALRVESGIDMTHKEAYLSDAEFEKVFGRDRAAFQALPAWRQQMAKKDKGLW